MTDIFSRNYAKENEDILIKGEFKTKKEAKEWAGKKKLSGLLVNIKEDTSSKNEKLEPITCTNCGSRLVVRVKKQYLCKKCGNEWVPR